MGFHGNVSWDYPLVSCCEVWKPLPWKILEIGNFPYLCQIARGGTIMAWFRTNKKHGNWPLATGTNACSGLLDLVSLETFLKCCWRHENYHGPQDIKATEQTFLVRCNLLSPLGRWNVCDKCNWPICKGLPLKWGIRPISLDGLFHGKSQTNGWWLGVHLFLRKPPSWLESAWIPTEQFFQVPKPLSHVKVS